MTRVAPEDAGKPSAVYRAVAYDEEGDKAVGATSGHGMEALDRRQPRLGAEGRSRAKAFRSDMHGPLLAAAARRLPLAARAESANDKIEEPEKRGRGFGGFSETRKRPPIAFGRPGAVEPAAERARRRAEVEARRAGAKAGAAAERKRRRR